MRRPNLALTEQLDRAGWRPSHLTRAVNDLLGDGYLRRSTVSEWLHAGRIPREPVPAIVAQLLTEATGSPVSVRDLWPGAALARTWSVPADDGLTRIAAAPCPAVALANDWLHYANHRTGSDQRHFIPVPRTALPEGDGDRTPANRASAHPHSAPAKMTAHHISGFPVECATLQFAHRQVLAFAELLMNLPQDDTLIPKLLVATTAAQEAAHGIGEHGLAQRYEMSLDILAEPSQWRSQAVPNTTGVASRSPAPRYSTRAQPNVSRRPDRA
ncbi:hypothetical protein NGB36_28340 [Streptomyces sp. RB6PN25]|uniref:Transcriptional regulator n=1 Tax=Streptomyces humicola TaxID=2953240 RepID=A0ABT1Q4X6_9ACTN|nr:hypothetical protein [Streptomyces humicola]MCQ4084385.1 hypothetical protein [Streptomyces humicola]